MLDCEQKIYNSKCESHIGDVGIKHVMVLRCFYSAVTDEGNSTQKSEGIYWIEKDTLQKIRKY